jgi:hypothetical protein
MRSLAGLMVASLFLQGGCALKSTSTPPPGEKLYFALEVRKEGRLVAKPKLLGELGKPLRAQRKQPGAAMADYELLLQPSTQEGEYRLVLDLKLPQAQGHSELSLLHAEERQLELGAKQGDLQISLLLMRVDSPEFRALMTLSDAPADAPKSI